MRRLLAVPILACAIASLMPLGCGDPAGTCEDYCTYRAKCCATATECTPDKTDIPTCVSTCEDLSKDPAFASAMQKQAGCFASSTCEDITTGKCNPSP